MKPGSSQFTVGLLIGLLAACGVFAWLGQRDSRPNSSAGRVLTVAHALPVTHPVHLGLENFAKELTALSGGTLSAQIYPSEQLGNETECLEKIQQGSIDVTKVSAAPVGNFVPLFRIFSLPYLFRDHEHFWKALDGEVGRDLLAALSKTEAGSPSGIVGLTYYDAGSRSFYTTRPVTSPADLAGMKIRVQQDPVAEDMVRAMGASAVAMAMGELYTSLKQGGVDGAENNPPSFHSSRHFEICKHYILDEHTSVPDVLVASSKLWESLNETERGWVMEAAKRSSLFQRGIWAEASDQALADLKAAGVEIRTTDPAPFREASASVTAKYATGERAVMVERIQAVK
ncbi:MAG: TRAP transporter substrate-binding protein [Akkermansiaceae bacterium]|jgi:tripartite ATP-independent transporter DctP family solute receptor|nr:TRAP transporter substrate-binding protein [Akkermansiaceae bacterium]